MTASAGLPGNSGSSGHRKDIEGLRAIAILLVVAAHAAVPGLDGGFVGVDVFFVLSGFLITGILARAADGENRGLIDFYARRLRRLLPALLLVFAATVIAASRLLAPIEQLDQGQVAAAVPFWITNIVFTFRDIDYFGGTADSSLFLHTWSLGVEEQFYLVWPTLVFLAMGVWRLPGATPGARQPARLMLLLATIGLVFSLFQTVVAPISAYYLLPSRFWQFAVGGLISLKFGRDNPVVLRKGIADSLSWLGLAAIFVAAILLDGKQPYPGFWALLPTLGAATVIAAGTSAPTLPARFLSAAPLQWLGRLSYGWYLWHWPVLLLGRSVLPEQGLPLSLALAILSLGLAVATYHLVEAPIRYNRWLVARPGLTIMLALLFMAAGTSGAFIWKSAATNWAAQPEQFKYLQVKAVRPIIYEMGCDDWYQSSRVRPCLLGGQAAPKTAVIFGDSIGLQWFPALANTFPAPEWKVVVLTKSSCPILDKPFFYARIGRRYFECEIWRDASIRYIASLAPDVVVVGSAASYDASDQQWPGAEKRILTVLGSVTKSLVVIAPTPNLGFDGPHCLARKEWRPAALAKLISCSSPLASSAMSQEYAQLKLAATGLGNVRILNLDDIVCPGNVCRAQLEGQIVYRDDKHLSVQFVEGKSAQVAARMKQAAAIPVN